MLEPGLLEAWGRAAADRGIELLYWLGSNLEAALGPEGREYGEPASVTPWRVEGELLYLSVDDLVDRMDGPASPRCETALNIGELGFRSRGGEANGWSMRAREREGEGMGEI